MNNKLSTLKDDELIHHTKILVQEERRIQVNLLLHLKEIETRRLFLDLGYSSLFDFVIKELGYSESSGYRRIQAMRLLKSVPELEHKICDGSFSLTAAAQVQTFIKQEEKQNGPVSKLLVQDLVLKLENKSSRDVEKHLFSLKPTEQLTSEKVRQVTETHTEIKLVVSDDLRQKLDQLKLLLSHVNPEMNYLELLSYLANKAIGQLAVRKSNKSERKRTLQIESPSAPEVKNPSAINSSSTVVNSQSNKIVKEPHSGRYISTRLKAEIWKRDRGCCTFVSKQTGKACESKYQVQIDHIHPFALGGKTEFKNLRLLCAQHNRWYSRKVFAQ